jgi:tungstate transport system ATP-binding protein
MSGPIIEIPDLQVIRNNMPALSVTGLSFSEGRVYSLIGPNGAGKSTLLLSLMGLVQPDWGCIRYRGREIPRGSSAYRYRRNLAMVFQEPLLFTGTVFDNVASGLKMRGMKRDKIRAEASQAMELLGISHLARRRAGALSGGEAQRVSIARALAVDPEILLMDEPFSSLDAPSRESLITDLDRIIRDRGITTVFATHDRGEATRLADEIIVMNGGAVAQAGSPGVISLYPASEFVASFMGTETILTGRVSGSGDGLLTITVDGAVIEAAGEAGPGSSVTFCVHPESILFSKERPGTSARNSFSGRVARVVPTGLYRKVYVNCGITLMGYVTGRSMDDLGIREGGQITASFKATAVHIIKVSPQ